ncbi:MAG TPA: maltotransferase domain-containing protein, partial [Candidatus Dormibacteraeota bacterium]|nr:maltotransferase domain-containing protein [Candidatus Dormibacteraeota bacterium]
MPARDPSGSVRPISVLGDRRRAVIDHVRPVVDCGRLPAKATAGLSLEVSARIVVDGHDPVLAWVWEGEPGEAPAETRLPKGWRSAPARSLGEDRYAAEVVIRRTGAWSFAVVALADEYGAWVRDLRIR